MDAMNWIWAAVALSSGLLIGELAGRLARSAFARPTDNQSGSATANVVGKVVFWASVLISLVVAAGALSPDTLDEFTGRLNEVVPSLLLAAAWLIAGYAASAALSAMVGQSALKATGVRQVALERTLRVSIMTAAGAAALNQAGVSSAIVVLVVAAAVATPVLTIVVLTSLGGRQVASQIASGRALRHHLQLGDEIRCMGQQGIVTALHSTAVELCMSDGATAIVPNSQFTEAGFDILAHDRASTLSDDHR